MKIFIVAGGTGGHLLPAIRLAEEIKLQNKGTVLFITSSRKEDGSILKEKNIAFVPLPVIGFQSVLPFNLIIFFAKLLVGTIKSLFLILSFKPSIIIGFGGYISGPIVLLGAMFKIKTVIHEQNVYPGKTNRILANFVDRIMLGFPETVRYLKRFEYKMILSGNPLRREFKRGQKGISDIFSVLTIGGSQGSHILNRLIPKAVALLSKDKKDVLEMVHIAGDNDKEEVIKAYNDIGIKNRVFSFTNDVHKLYNESDFVIARAGAMTVSELLYLAKPSILIPYVYRGGHQRFNAEILEKMGSSIVLDERKLTPEDLGAILVNLMDRDVLEGMSNRARNSNQPDPCDVLIKEIFKVTGK